MTGDVNEFMKSVARLSEEMQLDLHVVSYFLSEVKIFVYVLSRCRGCGTPVCAIYRQAKDWGI